LAGRGSRFFREGYLTPKPLISVSGKPMIIQAVAHLPLAEHYIFVVLKEHEERYSITKSILHYYPNATFVLLDAVTEGQACTCALGLQKDQFDKPLLIGACDSGMVWNSIKYEQLINDNSIDAIIWTFKHHQASKRFPNMYGWVYVDGDNNALEVSVKKPISTTPENDHAIVGTFYFKKAQYFNDALVQLRAKNIRINNEFYVDSCMQELIENDLKVKVFEINYYVGWGTPNDLKTYEYWQSFFHKCSWHPYNLKQDYIVEQENFEQLHKKYYLFEQPCVALKDMSCHREML
jgi:NDP-sugar pyrophosphorylase family protein